MFTLNCKGKIVVIDEPVVMGIINLTPDSFFSGSRHSTIEDVLSQAGRMLQDGAKILDLGGQSTKPGSVRISVEEELNRVIPPLQAMMARFPDALISIDTYNSEVARNAIDCGASIINDVSFGELDPNMLEVAASLHVPYIGMHMKGSPENMQKNSKYDNVVSEVIDYLAQKAEMCKQKGIIDLIIDPGFGFGKTLAHNYELLYHLKVLKILEKPLLCGVSRKSMVQKVLNTDADHSLNGTTVLHTIALLNGASILRAHDVKEAVEAVKLVNAYKNAAPNQSGIKN
jgi:dihydropteroate synthase